MLLHSYINLSLTSLLGNTATTACSEVNTLFHLTQTRYGIGTTFNWWHTQVLPNLVLSFQALEFQAQEIILLSIISQYSARTMKNMVLFDKRTYNAHLTQYCNASLV